MKRFVVWALAGSLAIAPTAPAYAQESKPRARAFFEPGTDVSTPEKYAQEIERCANDATRSRATCDMLVASFNEVFSDIDDVADYRELANYFRKETEVRRCPQVRTRVAHVVGDKIGFSERELRADESCFFDANAQRYVSSAGCGQWTPDLPPARTAAAPAEPAEPPASTPTPPPTQPSTPATFGKDAPSAGGLVLPPQNPQAGRPADDKNFLERHWKKGAALGLLLVGIGCAVRGCMKQEQVVCVMGACVEQ